MEINIWRGQGIILILFKMIPVKIITFKEAKKQGLTNDGEDLSGEGIAGAMCSAKKEKKPGAKEIFLEKYIVKNNGKKELIFLHDDLRDEKSKRGELFNYLNQFNKIKGKPKAKYIKNNKLIIPDQEV